MRREEQWLPQPPTPTPVFPAATFSNDECSLNVLSLLKRSQREIWCGPLTPGEHMYLHLSGNTLAQAYFFSRGYWFCWLAAGESIKNKLQSQRSRVSNGLHDNRTSRHPHLLALASSELAVKGESWIRNPGCVFNWREVRVIYKGFCSGWKCRKWATTVEGSKCACEYWWEAESSENAHHSGCRKGNRICTEGSSETVLSWGLK